MDLYCKGMAADDCIVAYIKSTSKTIGEANILKRNIATLSDRKAAVKALNSKVVNFKVVYSCHICISGWGSRTI